MSDPSMPSPVTAGAIPWYQSAEQRKKIVTAVLVIAAMLPKSSSVSALGLDNAEVVAGYVTDAAGTAALAQLLWSFIQRFRSKLQPLTFTKAAAAAHPSTVAVVATQAAMAQAGIPTAATLAASITNGTLQPDLPPGEA